MKRQMKLIGLLQAAELVEPRGIMAPSRFRSPARPEEFMEALLGHLGTWEDDPIVFDRANGIFADPDKKRAPARGKFLSAVCAKISTVDADAPAPV
jgi:hypothetical protein